MAGSNVLYGGFIQYYIHRRIKNYKLRTNTTVISQ